MPTFEVSVGSNSIFINHRVSYTVLLRPELGKFLNNCAIELCEVRNGGLKDFLESPDSKKRLLMEELKGLLQKVVNNAEDKLSRASTPAASPQGSLASVSPRGSFRHFAFDDFRAIESYNSNILKIYNESFKDVMRDLITIMSPTRSPTIERFRKTL